MAKVTVTDKGCRGCTMCVDICPGEIFDYVDDLAIAARSEDCIGCFSCYYICPSQCIELEDVHLQRPFHRIEENVALVEKFLQEKTATKTLTNDDWDEAYQDVAATLISVSDAVVEVIGRGSQALGRRAGIAASEHLPEIYEEAELEGVLRRLQGRFRHSFEFDFSVAGEEIGFDFKPCGLLKVVQDAGQKPGEAMLCQLFHGYLAGMLGAYTGKKYGYEVPQVGPTCTVKVSPA